MGDPVVMLSLYPEFPKAVMSSLASCGEFVFLLDRSGSMDCSLHNRGSDETRIGSARVILMAFQISQHGVVPRDPLASYCVVSSAIRTPCCFC